METNIAILASILSITLAACMLSPKKTEHFTLPSPRPPAWFLPQEYKVEQWIVPLNQDRLSHIECLSYNRGDPIVLNYNSAVYRMWRF